jgi:antitoxin component YwqK of YwqJK toxin-antitoxin module
MIHKAISTLSCCLALFIGCAGSDQNLKRETIDLAKSIVVTNPTKNTYNVFWPDKSLMAEGPVAGNKKNGTWKLYFKGTGGKSVMAEINFKDDMPDGKIKEFYPSGKTMIESEYKMGILHGRYMSFYESGIGKIEAYFRDGRKNGKSFEYYDNGNTKENAYYQNDLRDGMSTIFYPNGKREAMGRYIAGKKNGLWDHFDQEMGMLEARGMYANDKKTGKWTFYDKTGKVTEKQFD